MSDLTLGSVLTAARGNRPLRHMASLTGIDHSLLAKIEKGEVALPRRETMYAIANGYGLDIDFLARVAYMGGGNPAEAADSTGLDSPAPAASNEAQWAKKSPGRQQAAVSIAT